MERKESKYKVYLGWFARRAALAAYDVLAVNFAYWLALIVRFYVNLKFMPSVGDYIPAFWSFTPIYTIVCLVVFTLCGMYRGVWKYAGIHDLNRIVLSSLVTGVLHVVGTLVFTMRMPITYYVFGAIIQFGLITAGRFSYRVLIAERSKMARRNQKHVNTMVVGVGETSRMVRARIEGNDSPARIVCIFTAKPHEAAMLNGVPVVSGIEQFLAYVQKYQVENVILADSIAPSAERKRLKELCAEAGIAFQDFSGYLQYEGDSISLKRQMEYVAGPVEVLIDGKSLRFENGEAAVMAITENYQVKTISCKQDHIVVEAFRQHAVLNQTDESWAREMKEQTGEDISFF